MNENLYNEVIKQAMECYREIYLELFRQQKYAPEDEALSSARKLIRNFEVYCDE